MLPRSCRGRAQPVDPQERNRQPAPRFGTAGAMPGEPGKPGAVSEARVLCGDCLSVMRDFAPGSLI